MLVGHLFAGDLFSVVEESDGSILTLDYFDYSGSRGKLDSLSLSTHEWTTKVFPRTVGAPGWTATVYALAASSDGSKLYVTETCYPGYEPEWYDEDEGISKSTDSGSTWARKKHDGCYTAIASSTNGMTVIALGNPSLTITTDGGETWNSPKTPPSDEAIVSAPSVASPGGAIAISSDGTKVVITTGLRFEGMWHSNFGREDVMFDSTPPGHIHTSSDSGLTWAVTSAPAARWMSVASSLDGLKLAAVVWSGGIYVSTDRGGTWTLTSATTQKWSAIASSSDGSRLIAVVFGGGLYSSTNGGTSWNQLTSVPSSPWARVASSADGTELIALAIKFWPLLGEGGAWISFDAGATWTKISSNNPHPPVPPFPPPAPPPSPPNMGKEVQFCSSSCVAHIGLNNILVCIYM